MHEVEHIACRAPQPVEFDDHKLITSSNELHDAVKLVAAVIKRLDAKTVASLTE
jgi:hypothetical protein